MDGVSDVVRFWGEKRDGVSIEKCVEWMFGEWSGNVFVISVGFVEIEWVGFGLFVYSWVVMNWEVGYGFYDGVVVEESGWIVIEIYGEVLC